MRMCLPLRTHFIDVQDIDGRGVFIVQGIDAYEPPVVDMLIDFVYSYSKDVLLDARAYGEAAGKAAGSIGSQDIELAIRSRSFAQPVSLQVCCVISNSGSPLDVLSGSLRKVFVLGTEPLVFANSVHQ